MAEHHQDSRTRSMRIVRQSTFRRPFILGVATVAMVLAGLALASLCMSGSSSSGGSRPVVIFTRGPVTLPSTSVPHPTAGATAVATAVATVVEQQPGPVAPRPAGPVPAPSRPVSPVHATAPVTHAPSPSPAPPSPSRTCILGSLLPVLCG